MPGMPVGELLPRAIEYANRQIQFAAKDSAEFQNLPPSFIIAVLEPGARNRSTLSIGRMGDCHAYLLRGDTVYQLTAQSVEDGGCRQREATLATTIDLTIIDPGPASDYDREGKGSKRENKLSLKLQPTDQIYLSASSTPQGQKPQTRWLEQAKIIDVDRIDAVSGGMAVKVVMPAELSIGERLPYRSLLVFAALLVILAGWFLLANFSRNNPQAVVNQHSCLHCPPQLLRYK